MTRPVVFLGPSLPLCDARAILDADYRPPAGQGDLLRAAFEQPPAIALIDGIFRNAPTVRHREILWALSRGLPVFGASSMGALRAAELHGHGMIGAGLIFRWYRRFALLPDDAVAITHGPAELGAPPLSAALVDIRRTIAAARKAGALSARHAAGLTAQATAQPFAERQCPPGLTPYRRHQKAEDARLLLRRMATHAATGHWPTPKTKAPPVVHAWLDDLKDSGIATDCVAE